MAEKKATHASDDQAEQDQTCNNEQDIDRNKSGIDDTL
jgi:hypothetical protein